MSDQRSGRPPGWKRDPSGRHFGRYWDGEAWTEHVISAEKVQSIDPVPYPPEEESIFPAAPPVPTRPAAGIQRKASAMNVWATVRGWPRWAQWAVGVVAVLVIVSAASAGSDDEETVSAGATPATSAMPPTSAEVQPTQPAGPQAKLQSAVAKALGSGRKGVPRLGEVHLAEDISVSWAIGEGLTEGLTKDKARREAVEILEAVRKEGLSYGTLTLVGSYELVDRFGASSESTVVRAVYAKSTVDRINFSGFDFKNAFTIASPAIIHPTFQY